jgi:putative transposase
MSRLRRLVLSDRFFFISCRVLRERRALEESDFKCLARVLRERREKYHFLLTAWVFLPDHWHAILFPRYPATISRVMESIKVGSTLRVNASRKESGLLWQPRFFDRVLRSVKEYNEKAEYIHMNPVRAGLVERMEHWRWSSVHDYSEGVNTTFNAGCNLAIDRVLLPADERSRI